METEILYLSGFFEQIFIVPRDGTGSSRNLPANCEIIQCPVKFIPQAKLRKYIRKNLTLILKVLSYTLLYSADRKFYLSYLKKWVIQLTVDIELSKQYRDFLQPYLQKTEVLYFYWFVEPYFNFCLLKEQKHIDHKLVCRAHGYDFDQKQGRFPLFREFELKYLNILLPVSKYGYNYIRNRYKSHIPIMDVCYLGTKNSHQALTYRRKDVFHIVSCSSLIPLKRVHLIIEILKELSFVVKWTHIGTGELLEDLRDKARTLPSHVAWEFKGQLSNYEVLKFYKIEQVDLFVNTSSLEGIPVSIMEAISFGIPAFGCDICGVPEIVTPDSGFLLPLDFTPQDAAKRITEYYQLDDRAQSEFRRGVKKFWNDHFNAESNYPMTIKKHLLS